ncbi:hypothetical protein SDC9_173408 [bioreactor metagenome]|uniref:Secretion system C-terminal sorting domain-containing protein n=1 Tax=bioreactor metagenome TaxID=1076179 RepID=A0A645GIE7_9ZZZZ
MQSFYLSAVNRNTIRLSWETNNADGIVAILTTSSTVPTAPSSVPATVTTAPSGASGTPVKLANAINMTQTLLQWTDLTRNTTYYVHAWAYSGTTLSNTCVSRSIRTPRKDVVEMSEHGTFSASEITPLPAINEASIDISTSESGSLYVSIYDLAGSKVLDIMKGEPISSDTELRIPLNIRDLASGVYTVMITIGDDKVMRQLIIKK